MAAFVPPSTWQPRLSPNHSARPANTPISGIVMHCDASSSVASSMDWIRRPESRASYHVLIGRTGNIFLIVPPERKAWHAGRSAWNGVPDCNNYTIGVSMSNRNDGEEPYPQVQIDAAVEVCAVLCKHFRIPVERITTHAIVATPKGRKTDPIKFDLDKFQESVAEAMLKKKP